MGYILLSPEHIKFTDEKEDKKWHLFNAEICGVIVKEECDYDDDDDFDIFNEEECSVVVTNEPENEKSCITAGDVKIDINDYPECENTENDEEKICSKSNDLEEDKLTSFIINYNLPKIKGQYLNKFIKEYIKEHDKNKIEKYIFKKTGNKYYTDEDRTFFYSDDADTIRIIACMLRRCICGNCMRTLYSNLDNEDKD